MLTSFTFARRSIVLLASAAALGLAALLIAPSAGAEPMGPAGGASCSLSTSGSLYMFPEGTRMTVTMGDGHKFTFVCRNGNWVEEKSGLIGSVPNTGTFQVGTRTFVRTTSAPLTR